MGRETAGLQTESTQAAGLDRRRSARYELDITMLARPANNRSRAIHGRIVNLSRGGMSAAIAANLQPGEVVALEFKLPYATAGIFLEAAVRRRNSHHYSLEFVHVTASDQEKINRTCAALALLQ